MIDYYEILEVSPNASLEVIKGAYKILLHRYDVEHDTEDRSEDQKLNNLNLAYEVLSDPDKREIYDIDLQKVKNLHKESMHSHLAGKEGDTTAQSLLMDQAGQPVHLGHKRASASVLNRLKFNRWGWSISVLAVVVVLISMVQPDPEKVLQGQLAVKSHLEKRDLRTPVMKIEVEKQKPVRTDDQEMEAGSQPK